MPLTTYQLDDLTEFLEETCLSLEEAVEERLGLNEDSLSETDRQYINNTLFECAGCSYWFKYPSYSTSDDDDATLCAECAG